MARRIKSNIERLAITNPDTIFYPAGKFTKADVVEYYIRVAPFLFRRRLAHRVVMLVLAILNVPPRGHSGHNRFRRHS